MRAAPAIIAVAAILAGCGDDDTAGGEPAGASGTEGVVEARHDGR